MEKLNVEVVRDLLIKSGKTAYQLAKELPLTEAGINKIISRESKNPRQSTLQILHTYFTQQNKGSYKTSKGSEEPIYNKNGNKFIELPDGTYDVEVEELPFLAYASFADSLEHGEVYEDLNTRTFNVDQVGRGNYMSFIVKGDSMNGGGINDTPDGAKVLGRELGRHHWRDGFNPSKYGWIILSKRNIFHKDIIDLDGETGEITCHSRNKSPEYADFKLSLNDVYQIFKVIKRIF